MSVRATMLVLCAFAAWPLHAEDWITTDGQTYRNVKVLSHDDAFVTILDSDGGARVPLRTLGPDLQKRFGYDAAKAAAREAATVAADKRDRAALAAQQSAALAPPITPAPAPPTLQPAPAVAPSSAPPAAVLVHGPPAPASTKPAVDVTANKLKIEDDEKALEDAKIDLRDAERDSRKTNYHVDDLGRVHPNTVGEAPADRITSLNKKISELEAEIKELKAQNAAAGYPVDDSGPGGA